MKSADPTRFQQFDHHIVAQPNVGRHGVSRHAPRYGLSFLDLGNQISSPHHGNDSRSAADHLGSFGIPPPGPVVQRKLKLDGGEDELEGIQDLPLDLLLAGVGSTAELLIQLPGPAVDLTSDELLQLHEWMEKPAKIPDSQELRAVYVRMISHGAFTPRPKAGDTSWYLYHAKRENLAGLGNFLRTNPKVNKMLVSNKVSWAPFSDADPGSAKFQDDQIHLSKGLLNMKSAKGFMRTVAHEVGHATLQRLLIREEYWDITKWKSCGEEVPEEVLNNGGKMLYTQWKELRKHPEYFAVQDLRLKHMDRVKNPTTRGEGRQAYLAGSFTEFCAESFALLALNPAEFKAAIDELCELEEVPGIVKVAWSNALRILSVCEAKLLGAK